MISIEELKEYAKIRDYNLGQAEKDYYQTIVLFILYREFGRELVFKGGTCLTKCYGFARFSEDLDFTLTKPELKNKVKEITEQGLKRFNLNFEIREEIKPDSADVIIRLEGPLFNGSRNSMCKILLNISYKEKVELETKSITIGKFIKEIPDFDAITMNKKEIAAEKIRAIMTRTKARDIYDFFFLIEDSKPDRKLVNKKLEYYNKTFDKKEFKRRISEDKGIWAKELRYLVKKVPEFKEVIKKINKIKF